MKFTLIFSGELPAKKDVSAQWKIREQFDPQLQELWKIHPTLHYAKRQRYWPTPDSKTKWVQMQEGHHSFDNEHTEHTQRKHPDDIDLCDTLERGGRTFFPLVRQSFALSCALNILFLRKEEPGRVVYQGGDLDNRLKNLFDALAVPREEQIRDSTLGDPIYCLLEDDALIMHCNIKTQRLLSKPDASKHDVHLVVEVDVRVTQPRTYNIPFLGD